MKSKYLIPASVVLSLGIALSGYFVKQGMTNHTDFNRYVSVKVTLRQVCATF